MERSTSRTGLTTNWVRWSITALAVLLFAITNLPWQLDDYDQAKQAYTSWEMAGQGHWFYQHTPNESIATKPPLVGWISAGLFELTRWWEGAWRLPSFLAALAILNGQACTPLPVGVPLDAVVIGGNPPGTFSPGCYFRAGALDITASTTVTLNGAGVYIFRSTGGALTTGANSHVNLTGGACASDVFWAPVGATTLGANAAPSLNTATFQGNILDAAGVTIGHFANLTGRALAFGGTVTVDAATISVPTCTTSVAGGGAIPTLSEWALVLLGVMLAVAGFAAVRKLA